MENESNIYIIRINFDYFYNYSDYVNKKEIYVSSLDSDGNEINYWKKYKNTYHLKLRIVTTSGNNFVIPIKLHFGEIDDWVLIKYLAIIDSESPNINYQFYKEGEKYGDSDSTIVRFENKILKSFHCVENSKKISLINFVKDYENKSTQKDLDELVKIYMERIVEIEREKFEEQEFNENDYFEDSYYNDQLDMNQQSAEFWDNL